MTQELWQEKWRINDIAFHQQTINPLLKAHLPRLKLNPGDDILVPLCGKSLDMGWFNQCRYRVMGVELSSVAIADYFDELGVKPQRQIQGNFTRWWHKQIQIWCGNIFDLNLLDVHRIKLIYDCAALTALGADERQGYVDHFAKILPTRTQIMLMTTETADEQYANSVARIDSEVKELYQSDYRIQLLHGQDSLKIDPEFPQLPARMLEEKIYLMHNRFAP